MFMDTETPSPKAGGRGEGAPTEPIAGTDIDALLVESEAVTSRNTSRFFWRK